MKKLKVRKKDIIKPTLKSSAPFWKIKLSGGFIDVKYREVPKCS